MQDLTVEVRKYTKDIWLLYVKKFLVNRRYQRKLIWTIEEKSAFINSIMNGYPVPLILLAEVNYDNSSVYEIIDGMQRLNAIVSFIRRRISCRW